MKKRISRLESIPRAVTPILVPLKDELTLAERSDPEAAVAFDLDGSGRILEWGWIRPEAAWLVYRDRRSHVESGLQLFGNVTFWVFWENGYAALASLDDEGDGRIAGVELEGLALWNDRDSDGVFQETELVTLKEAGVTALSCTYRQHPEGFPYAPEGLELQDRPTRPTYDWSPRTTGGGFHP